MAKRCSKRCASSFRRPSCLRSCTSPGAVSPTIEALPRHTSFLQVLPQIRRFYRHALPAFPIAIELFDLDGFDLVVSSSHCAAKSVVVPGRARHVCYCHTPMRYAWDQFPNYFGPDRLGRLGSLAAAAAMRRLARWDAATAGRVDRYVANSRYVAGRIRRYYGRDALVVYPPVDTAFYSPDGRSPEPYFLIVSALVPYKRIDIAIEAARLAGLPLRIVGDGPDRGRLEAAAGPGVTFLGTPYRTRTSGSCTAGDRCHPAWRGGLRDRRRRGPGLRPAGGLARGGRGARNGDPRPHRRAGGRSRLGGTRRAVCVKPPNGRSIRPSSAGTRSDSAGSDSPPRSWRPSTAR